MTWEILKIVTDNLTFSTNIRNWLEIIGILLWVLWVFLYYIYPKFRIHWNLYSNLSKKIYILLPDDKEWYMSDEIDIIKNSIFPKKNIEIIKGYHLLSKLSKSSIVIVYYIPHKINEDINVNIIWRARSEWVPIIFYCKWKENFATDEHKSLIDKNWYLTPNSVFRLLSDMYAIMSLYNNK